MVNGGTGVLRERNKVSYYRSTQVGQLLGIETPSQLMSLSTKLVTRIKPHVPLNCGFPKIPPHLFVFTPHFLSRNFTYYNWKYQIGDPVLYFEHCHTL